MDNKNFNEMGLSPKTLKAIEDMGFIEPSPIQAMAIPVMMTGKDIIAQAQTGTGKTAAFGVPIIEKLNLESKAIQAVVLTPTRELAIQVAEEINKLAKHHRGLNVVPIYGGQPIDRQIRALRMGVQVVIGTPGRMLDHLERGTMKLEGVKTIVLDEADEMLDMGFIDDIRAILSKASAADKQVVLFSATMPPEIMGLAKRFQKEPQHIQVVHKELTVPKVKQCYFEVRESDKIELLTRLVDFYNPNLAIVFVKTKVGAEEVKEKIHAAGYSVEALHGDMKQTQRDYVMKRFRNSDFDILVATDVAARGLDVDDIDVVFNYDLPQDEEYYVHRIGRTARAGREGLAVTFVTMREFRKLKDIERYTKSKIERQKIPTLRDVENVRNQSFINDIKEVIDGGGLDKYITLISDTLSEFTAMEVAAALMKMGLDFDSEDDPLERASRESERRETREYREPRDYRDSRENGEYARFFMTIGKQDKISMKDLLHFISDKTGLKGREIGDIAFLEKFTFVNIPLNRAEDFREGMKGASYQGRRIKVELANNRR